MTQIFKALAIGTLLTVAAAAPATASGAHTPGRGAAHHGRQAPPPAYYDSTAVPDSSYYGSWSGGGAASMGAMGH